MAASDPELSEKVQRLEAQVAALEQRLHRLESPPLTAAQAVPPSPPPPKESRDLEGHLGTYWLSRAGVVTLITGVALLITYYFGDLGALARVTLGYLLSAGLSALGLWVARRHALFGRIVFGGGLALAYFVTYALHFVPAVRVIDSELVTLVLLAFMVTGIVTIAHRMQSETVAGIALFLALHTGVMTELTTWSLLSSVLLALGALFFLVRNRWVIVPLSSLLAVYTTHWVWAGRTAVPIAGSASTDHLLVSLGFLGLYFLLFTVALLARPGALSLRVSLAFCVLNWAGLGLLGARELRGHGDAALFTFLLALALTLGAAAGVAVLRKAPPGLVHAYLGSAMATLALALPVRLEGAGLLLAWACAGLVTAVLAQGLRASALRWVGLALFWAALFQGVWFVPHPLLPALLLACCLVLAERLPHTRWLSSGPVPGSTRLQQLLSAAHAAGAAGAVLLVAREGLAPGLETLAWVLTALALFLAGFALQERWYRWIGLLALGVAVVRLLALDLSGLSAGYRVLTFIALGVILLAVSFTYTRARERRGPEPQDLS